MTAASRPSGLFAVVVAAIAMALASPALAGAASSEPLFVFFPPQTGPNTSPGSVPPPGTGFDGPCGLAVSGGRLYVSDYYHHVVDAFTSGTAPTYIGQISKVEPIDGPCGLAAGSSGELYVNDFHRNVIAFANPLAVEPGATIDEADPTGVAVDPSTDRIYVDDRTSVSAYEPGGAPVLNGGVIGAGSIGDGYGVAAAAGRVYVPDAASNTVEVYEPAASTTQPVLTIAGPGLGFASLVDSAIAVDAAGGRIYVADNLQRGVSEHPQAAIDVFSLAGTYLGRLKYEVVDANPPGLTVDSAGNVYVTSGNSVQASIYGYGPEAETTTALPSAYRLAVVAGGSGSGAVASEATFGFDCRSSCAGEVRSGASVRLTATAAPGSTFAGWSGGGCEGRGTCEVVADRAVSVEADFEAVPAPPAPAEAAPGAGALPPAALSPGAGARHRPRPHRKPHHRARHRLHRHHRPAGGTR
jgi:hypothetical protein